MKRNVVAVIVLMFMCSLAVLAEHRVSFTASFGQGPCSPWQGCEANSCGWYTHASGPITQSTYGTGVITLDAFWTYPEIVVRDNWQTAYLKFDDGSTLSLKAIGSLVPQMGLVLAQFKVVSGTGQLEKVKTGSISAGYGLLFWPGLLGGQLLGELNFVD